MFYNALLSIKKNIGKTSLVFIIMTVVANLVIAGLSIQSATTKSMDSIRKSLGSEVTLSYNMSSLMKDREKGESLSSKVTSISEKTANQLVDLEYVDHYNYSVSVPTDSEDISPVETTTKSEDDTDDLIKDFSNKFGGSSQSSGGMPGGMRGGSGFSGFSKDDLKDFTNKIKDNMKNMDSNNFSVSGNTTMTYLSDFTEEKYTLKKGRLLTEEDANTKNCVIETNLAKENDLKVGSTFKVFSEDQDGNKTTVKLKVVGIYTINESDQMSNMMSNRQNPINTIYTSLETAQKLNGDKNAITRAVYYLDDPDHIEAFKEAAQSTNIDFDSYTLDANDTVYQNSIASLRNMNNFATIFLWIVIGSGSVILCLILILTLRSRFYEFGVMLSLGASKMKIVFQQLLEIGCIASIAFCLSLGTGKMVSNVISGLLDTSNTITENGTGEGTPPSMNGQMNFFDSAMKAPVTEELDVSINGETVMKLAGITGAICVVSVLLPACYILRLTPREILIRKEG